MLPQTEIVLWTTPEGPPKASQASECSELLDLTRAAYLIAAQRQPGKFTPTRDWRGVVLTSDRCRASQYEEAAEASKNYGNRINAPRARQRLVKGETLMRGMREALRCAGGRPRQWHYDCALSGAGAAVTQDRSA